MTPPNKSALRCGETLTIEQKMKTMKRVSISSVVLLAAGCGVFGAERTDQKPKYENDAGWSWHLTPTAFTQGSVSSRGVVMRREKK